MHAIPTYQETCPPASQKPPDAGLLLASLAMMDQSESAKELAPPRAKEFDEKTKRQLESLGYLGG